MILPQVALLLGKASTEQMKQTDISHQFSETEKHCNICKQLRQASTKFCAKLLSLRTLESCLNVSALSVPRLNVATVCNSNYPYLSHFFICNCF